MVLGGGRGTRLSPLTLHRSKPAVPIAGKYRLIDIPISNCLNSDLRRIFVLTQFNSESLNNHVTQTYKFDAFTSGFVRVLAAEQTEDSPEWFQGTADAVRQSLRHFRQHRFKDALILSGDQLYQMDYRRLLETHRRHVADATVAVIPVSAEQASDFGILKVNQQGRIVHFEEKPKPDRLPALVSEVPGAGSVYLASMGIYVFTREALEQRSLQDPELVDFGKHVIPEAVPRLRVHAHVHRGYWEDVGTIRSYYEANLALCQPVPPFDFYAAEPSRLHAPAFPAGDQDRGLHGQAGADLRGQHPRAGRARTRGGRDPQPDRPRCQAEGQPGARSRHLRNAGGDRAQRGARACPRWGSARTRASSTRSSTRTRASAAR